MNYAVDLLLDIEKFVFTGTVKVKGESKLLNAKHLKIHNQTLKGNDVHLTSDTVHFDGILNDQMVGFYRSKLPDGSFMFSTQMEAPYCREVFPCVDHPSRKATFDFSLIIPDHLEAIGNMPVLKEEPFSGKLHEFQSISPTHKLKRVYFQQTPLMSTYIIAFAVGIFHRNSKVIQSTSGKPIDLSIVTTIQSQLPSTNFALDVSQKCLQFFETAFNEPYPLSKVDMLSVPSFAMGAMENWGLITYREKSLLYDPLTSDIHSRQWVAGVINHELAHMWFGNLVTMKEWSDLWLNESFATFMGNLATEQQFPNWDIWNTFLADEFTRATSLDALSNSHPIHVPIHNVDDIDSIFDAITYSKGASLMKMLCAYVTLPVFLKGVQSYIKAFRYSNASADDLWHHLSIASDKDIKGFMDKWINTTGYPLIDASYTTSGNGVALVLKQQRYYELQPAKPDDSIWWIPLKIKLIHTDGTTSVKSIVFEQRSNTFKLESDRPVESILINSDSDAFCRVNYNWPLRKMALLNNSDQFAIVSDLVGLSISNHVPITTTLNNLGLLKHSQLNYVCISEICDYFDKLATTFNSEKTQAKINKLKIKVFKHTFEKVGFTVTDNVDYNCSRGLLITHLGMAGYGPVVDECRRLYGILQKGGEIESSLWQSVNIVCLFNDATNTVFRQVFNAYLKADNIDYKYALLSALSYSTKKEEIVELFDGCLNDKIIKTQDVHYVFRRISRNYKMYELTWAYLKSHFDKFEGQYHGCPDYLAGLLKNALQNRTESKLIAELEAVCKGNAHYVRKQKEAEESILINEKCKGINTVLLEGWEVAE